MTRAPLNPEVHDFLTGEGMFTHCAADGGPDDYCCDFYRDGFGFEYLTTECDDEMWYFAAEVKPLSDMVWCVMFRNEEGNNYVISGNGGCTSNLKCDAMVFNESHALQIAANIDARNERYGLASGKCKLFRQRE